MASDAIAEVFHEKAKTLGDMLDLIGDIRLLDKLTPETRAEYDRITNRFREWTAHRDQHSKEPTRESSEEEIQEYLLHMSALMERDAEFMAEITADLRRLIKRVFAR